MKELTYQEFDTLNNTCPGFNSLVSRIVDKTQNKDRRFFNIMLAYYAGYVAGMLHSKVISATRGTTYLGNYCIAMAPSGFGKGYSQTLIEKRVLSAFTTNFTHTVVGESFESNVLIDATSLAHKKKVSVDTIEQTLRAEFDRAGPFLNIFDSATKAAIRQQRQKIILAHAGSLNLVMDEFGSNLRGSLEELASMLELYDTGQQKEKLIKNTKESIRSVGLEGITPATMLLFGTPAKVFDNGPNEQDFMSLLSTGYARRSLFAWGTEQTRNPSTQPKSLEDTYERLVAASNNEIWEIFSDDLAEKAQSKFLHKHIRLEKPEELILLNYQMECEKTAASFNEFMELEKIEMLHRHSKALKLAGSMAVFEGEENITENTLLSAIRIVQESGDAFSRIMNRERGYATLARFLAAQTTYQTYADMAEKLPFFKTGFSARKEQLELAAAWGKPNLISIDKVVTDGIEMFKGTTLAHTDLERLEISASETVATGYNNLEVSWKRIDKLLKLRAGDLNEESTEPDAAVSFCSHRFRGGHRCKENVLNQFSMLVFDVDGTATIESVKDALKEYHFAICTTKSHTVESNRFRILIPTNVVLDLDADRYSKFVNNVMSYLPFTSDKAATSIAHKWETNPRGEVYINEGDDLSLFDVFPFIPGTQNDHLHKENVKELRRQITSHSKLIVWFVNQINQFGNRNNYLFRLGMMLIESGCKMSETAQTLVETNSTIEDPLDIGEVKQICKSIEGYYIKLKERLAQQETGGQNNGLDQ